MRERKKYRHRSSSIAYSNHHPSGTQRWVCPSRVLRAHRIQRRLSQRSHWTHRAQRRARGRTRTDYHDDHARSSCSLREWLNLLHFSSIIIIIIYSQVKSLADNDILSLHNVCNLHHSAWLTLHYISVASSRHSLTRSLQARGGRRPAGRGKREVMKREAQAGEAILDVRAELAALEVNADVSHHRIRHTIVPLSFIPFLLPFPVVCHYQLSCSSSD